MKNFRAAVCLAFGAVCFSACSLKYDENVNVEDSNPEFVFSETKVTRYEKGEKKAEATAENIEQYKNSDVSYAKGIKFTTYDEKAEMQSEGKCGLLYANTKNELYELYDDIEMFSKLQNARFYADVLRWNGKNEQLTGSRTDTVRIEKDDTIIFGSGFSASGVSESFEFSGAVSGEIETKTETEETEQVQPDLN